MNNLPRTRKTQSQSDVYQELRLVNVPESIILQAVLAEIHTNPSYRDKQQIIEPAKVCALLLNHQKVPQGYVTSAKGYARTKAKFISDWELINQDNKLLIWAIDAVVKLNQPRTLNQDLLLADKLNIKTHQTDSWRSFDNGNHVNLGGKDIFDILLQLPLINVVELEVVQWANEFIFSEKNCNVDLSDVAALVLNLNSVPTFYVTTAKEYNQSRTQFLTEYQSKVRSSIRKIIKQVEIEGSEADFNQNNLHRSKANQRKLKLWE